MTRARSDLVPANADGFYHCTTRCVRRAWLCGRDPVSGRDFDHRRGWIERRLAELAEIFAISIWSYAVMSNHVHAVIEVRAEVARGWSAEEVAQRWLRLYPKPGPVESAVAALAGNPGRIGQLRERLCSLSWVMKSLNEPIARRANREDGCTGRFWEGRFDSQALLDEAAVLSAMTYVDLNPIRAGITDSLEGSLYTSIVKRIAALAMQQPRESESLGAAPSSQLSLGESPVTAAGSLSKGLAPLAGEAVASASEAAHTGSQTVAGLPAAPGRTSQLSESAARECNKASEIPFDALRAILGQPGSLVGTLSSHDYIQLVDLAGREWHPGKRGRISGPPPAVLGRLGIAPDRWIDHVRAVKPKAGFYRAIGSEAALIDKAAAIGQRWLRGLSIARSLQR